MFDSSIFRAVAHCFRTVSLVVVDLVRLAFLAARSHRSLAAENLFLRKQLALFQERKAKPRRVDDATRWLMATLSQMFQWPDALVTDTLIRWHRKGFRLFWRWSRNRRGDDYGTGDTANTPPERDCPPNSGVDPLKQFREALPDEHTYRFVIHDRDSLFSKDLDRGVKPMRVRVLRTPVRAPKANAVSERLAGSLRRECLDLLIPVTEPPENDRRRVENSLQPRPAHSALPPGVPESNRDGIPASGHRQSFPADYGIAKTSMLGGLHHEYHLVKESA